MNDTSENPTPESPREPLDPVTPATSSESETDYASGDVNSVAATSTGLTPALGAGIAAAFPLIGGIIFLILEKKDPFTRFWAMQSLMFALGATLLSIVLTVAGMIFGVIPFLGWLVVIFLAILSFALWLAFFVIWIITIIKAFSGVEWEIPYIGKFARKQLENMPAGF